MGLPIESRKYLITGASGYVGGRLVRILVEEHFDVRILVRDRKRVLGQSWAPSVDIVEGSAENRTDLDLSLAGVHTAYYLLHSINLGPNFDEIEAEMARNFALAAEAAGVKQLVYLGGIANDKNISKHLASRVRTGAELASTSVPVMELRAGIIIGSGSASFEMLRHLTHRLPIMTTPKWVMNRTQPIAIRDVLYYLKQTAILSQPVGRIFDIGGPEVLTYADMMQKFAKLFWLEETLNYQNSSIDSRAFKFVDWISHTGTYSPCPPTCGFINKGSCCRSCKVCRWIHRATSVWLNGFSNCHQFGTLKDNRSRRRNPLVRCDKPNGTMAKSARRSGLGW